MAHRRAVVAVALSLLAAAAPARGSIEEFESFDVVRQELDDESLLDHRLTRAPREPWQTGAATRPRENTLSTAQGCLTSDRWFLLHRLDLEAPLGARARFALTLDQEDSDVLAYQHLDFAFRFRTPYGSPGFMVRPLAVKSRQDFGLTWRVGEDSLPARLDLRFVFEDTFNSLWVFRQTRVGTNGETERYEVHPYEPGVDLALHRGGTRARVRAHALTPSRRELAAFDPAAPRAMRELWGTFAAAELSFEGLPAPAGDLALSLASENRQAMGREQPDETPPAPVASQFRRQWSVSGEARWAPNARAAVRLAAVYAARDQHADVGGAATASFAALDRLAQLELEWRASPALTWRLGALTDRVSVARSGGWSTVGYGTRRESRGYLGATLRVGQVTLSAVEGFELDREPYDVWGIHDKGFVQLQARF